MMMVLKETMEYCGVGVVAGESSEIVETKRRCVDCQTTTTPCWRGGPSGPRTLCNACGIRYRKRRKALLGSEKGVLERNNKRTKNNSQISSSGSSSSGDESSDDLFNFELIGLKRRKLGEVEQAAILLMAMSCNYVYAN